MASFIVMSEGAGTDTIMYTGNRTRGGGGVLRLLVTVGLAVPQF